MANRTKKIDNVIWDLSANFIGSLSAGAQAINFAGVGTTPTTLLRQRGEVFGILDGTQVPGVAVRLTYGLIKVPEGSSTTVQYDPVADSNAPWIIYGAGHLAYEEMVTDVIDVPSLTGFRERIDGKAMRRIRPDEELQWVFTNTTLNSAGNVSCGFYIRWLQGF